ncbi:MAG: hypothetical protein ND866_10345 [Pyrinomonadaceae bacterium]|nr:hypothetical protein [Pyrinomonadaceae bacterium]
MSRMKSTLAATLLTLVLAVPALAGNIGSPGGTPPPPAPPPSTCGNIGSPGSAALGNLVSPGLNPTLVEILLAVLSLI